jgi:hypothetical protein
MLLVNGADQTPRLAQTFAMERFNILTVNPESS